MSTNIFNSIKLQRPNRNSFDLSHDVKLSFNMGQLVPIMATECIPGDKFNISCQSLVRFAPLIAPVMHRMNVFMHYFFVPNRILWANWENFITNTPDPTTDVAPVFPTVLVGDPSIAGLYGSLFDYLGIPLPIGAATEKISALALAAYFKIYNDYYRDQNLVDEIVGASHQYLLRDGDNTSLFTDNSAVTGKMTTFVLLRAWEHDYFTASLPFAQKGAQVEIPLGDVTLTAPPRDSPGRFVQWNVATPPEVPVSGAVIGDAVSGDLHVGTADAVYDPQGSLSIQPTSINDLRRAEKLQEWLERNARGGTRYKENILTHFGVVSDDARLQRPEYITGSISPVVISEIVNTTGTDALPQGNMAGHGISASSGKMGSYYCKEHGYIIGIISIMPKTAYQQGIPRHFLKTGDPFEFFWPAFAHIGEQEVTNREIFAFQGPSNGAQTFGYVPRYAEYKFEPSRVAGDFRGNLSFWHLGRIFTDPPALNKEFIECVPRTDIFAVTDPDDQHMYVHVLNQVRASRLMPKFGTPHW